MPASMDSIQRRWSAAMASNARLPAAVRRTRCARRSCDEVARVTRPSFTKRLVKPVRFPLLTSSRRASSPMVSPSRDSREAISSCASMSKRGSVVAKFVRKRPRTRDSIKLVQVSRRSQMRSGVVACCFLLLTRGRLLFQIALQLFLARLVLHRPGLLFVTLLGGGMQRPIWVAQVRPRQGAQISTPGGDDAVHLVGFRDITHGDRRNSSLIADAIAVGCLIHASIDGLRVFGSLTGRDMDDVASGGNKGARNLDGIVACDAALDPVGSGDTH